MDQHASVDVEDVIAAGDVSQAAQLAFEYMAATCAEVGGPIPAAPVNLPDPLRSEVEDLARAYPPPGSFFVAYRLGHPIGCVGLQAKEEATAEVKRLYVRSAERGGVGRTLMNALHLHARNAGLQRLVLDVIPSRVYVIEFYRKLGYFESEPYVEELIPMIFMRRTLKPET